MLQHRRLTIADLKPRASDPVLTPPPAASVAPRQVSPQPPPAAPVAAPQAPAGAVRSPQPPPTPPPAAAPAPATPKKKKQRHRGGMKKKVVPLPRAPGEPRLRTAAQKAKKARKRAKVAARMLEEARDLLRTLEQRHPLAFPALPARPRPLAVGIHNAIIAAHGCKPRLVEVAMKEWTKQHFYQVALAAGGPRIDLDGIEAGQVEPDQQAKAREVLTPKRPAARGKPRDRQGLPPTGDKAAA